MGGLVSSRPSIESDIYKSQAQDTSSTPQEEYIMGRRPAKCYRYCKNKPYGMVARVNIGQVILSIRCKDANKAIVMEALRRARYKFPGQQKIIVSKRWGFTPLRREEYLDLKNAGKLQQDGAYVQFLKPHGNLVNNLKALDRVAAA